MYPLLIIIAQLLYILRAFRDQPAKNRLLHDLVAIIFTQRKCIVYQYAKRYMLTYYLAKNSIFTSDSTGGSLSTGHLLGPFLQKVKIEGYIEDISDIV